MKMRSGIDIRVELCQISIHCLTLGSMVYPLLVQVWEVQQLGFNTSLQTV
jgi:hypothetical protein